MNLFIFCLSFIFISIVQAQYSIGTIPNQISNAQTISKDQLLTYLLSSNNRALPERIETLASVIQLMPQQENKRDQLAEVLKQSALQNLMVAASVCDTNKVPFASLSRKYLVAADTFAPVASRQKFAVANAANEFSSPLVPRQYAVANAANELTTPILPRKQYVVAKAANELNSSVLPRRQYVVANAATNELAAPILPRRQYVVSNAKEPVARDLAAMLPADLLSLIADYVPNSSLRYQYI